MAFSTLDAIRTGGLNIELGLTSDSDNSFGTTTQRNFYLQRAFAKLWPEMARLTRESVATVSNQTAYTLTSIREIERIDVQNSTGNVQSRIRSWESWLDEAAEPPTIRLEIPKMEAGLTLYVIGYKPYLVPAAGGSSCDLPPELEHVVCAGARVEAYRAKVNQFANFERFQNENRANALSPADILELLRQAQREYNEGRAKNARNLTAAKRAQLQTT